jgi:hypothetical protein
MKMHRKLFNNDKLYLLLIQSPLVSENKRKDLWAGPPDPWIFRPHPHVLVNIVLK